MIYIYIHISYIYYLWCIDDGVVLTPSHIQNLVRAWRQRDRSTDATRRVYRLYHMWRSWLGQHKALGDKYNYLMSLNVYIYVYICVCVIVRVYYTVTKWFNQNKTIWKCSLLIYIIDSSWHFLTLVRWTKMPEGDQESTGRRVAPQEHRDEEVGGL